MKAIETQKAPKAIGPYSQAIVANGFVFTAGQIAIDAKTDEMINGDARAQTRKVLENLEGVLRAAGSGKDKVVKTSVYLRDMDDFPEMNGEYAKFFGKHKPARSTAGVSRLPKDALVEIYAIATL